MRISDWSSDVCSSDLLIEGHVGRIAQDAYDLPKIRNAPHSFYQIAHRDRLVDKIRCDDKYCPHPLEGVIQAVEVEIVRDHRFAVGEAHPELFKFRGAAGRESQPLAPTIVAHEARDRAANVAASPENQYFDCGHRNHPVSRITSARRLGAGDPSGCPASDHLGVARARGPGYINHSLDGVRRNTRK